MEEIIGGIKEVIGSSQDVGSYPYFADKRYKAVKVDGGNFFELDKNRFDASRKVVFIDGGNQEIISAPNLSLQLIRVYYCVYQNNKRVKSERVEFFSLVVLKQDGDKQSYDVKTFGGVVDGFKVDSFEKTLSEGGNRVAISRIGDLIRGYAELAVAKNAAEDLDKGDIIVRDGTLEVQMFGEEAYFTELYRVASVKGVVVCGLAKTNSMFTDKGRPLGSVLNSMSKFGEWGYHPLAEFKVEDHQANMYMVKLHERGDYVFRLDVFDKVDFDILDILSLLYKNSRDPVFLGYPYGLVEADNFARVSNQEREYFLISFKSRIGKDWEKIEEFMKAKDAHSVLDNIG